MTGPEGSHGKDVKELYYYLDPQYPQAAYPYQALVRGNRERGKQDLELELLETGIFDDNRYFDVVGEHAKADTDDILIRITVANRGPDPATLHLLPTLWFRNTWSWGGKARTGLAGDPSRWPRRASRRSTQALAATGSMPTR